MVFFFELVEPTYDVFLSFRGADTRLSFTNYLYHALVNANLATFRDNEEIPPGEFLKPELETAIKASRASVIVLSKNYASSTWCLDELVLILEQKRISNQIVIPVFYHVDPTLVRKQQSSFGEAMEKMHDVKIKEARNEEERRRLAEKMEKWKDALTQVSNLKGIDASGRMEKELIEDIVNDIYSRLDGPLGTTTLPQLIGMADDIERITLWLKDGSQHTTDILTIWGMGGIGKTSLANYVYELHRHKYTRCSFVGDINRRCAVNQGMLDVQKQLCGDICKRNFTQVHTVFGYTSMICKALAREKVLVVLDDIDSLDQLDELLGDKGFHPGSKIIITTKDASLTERCALFNPQVQPKHTKVSLNVLCKTDSLELLCIHAFNSQKPKEGYEVVSEKLVKYCGGNPLALKVLGSSLRKQDEADLEEFIQVLNEESDSRIKNVLEMSFHSLPSFPEMLNYENMVARSISRSLTISIPWSLTMLSLKDARLANKSFPEDFSSLSVLKELFLDGNPIVAMPDCVRSLPRLETLSMFNCKRLTSVEHPPRTLRVLSHNSYTNSSQHYQTSLQKQVFDPEMSQLLLLVDLRFSADLSIQIEGIVKIQHMADVEEHVLRSLEWSDTEFIKQSCITQMYYELGIFSTFYEGKGIPHWIKHRRIGTSISFTIPSSANKLRGLNFCYVQKLKLMNGTFRLPDNPLFRLPLIKVSNITKNRTWIYKHCIESVCVVGERLIFLSHWLFGSNEMEAGDKVTITVTEERGQITSQCGIGLVYDDGRMEEEEDVLGYYKSWNHIIGGDLSAFQVTTGEYVLYFKRFVLGMNGIASHVYVSFLTGNPTYKEAYVKFRAFS